MTRRASQPRAVRQFNPVAKYQLPTQFQFPCSRCTSCTSRHKNTRADQSRTIESTLRVRAIEVQQPTKLQAPSVCHALASRILVTFSPCPPSSLGHKCHTARDAECKVSPFAASRTPSVRLVLLEVGMGRSSRVTIWLPPTVC